MATTVAYPGVGGHSALTSTAGALLTVLDAVLVTGQGWTKPFQVGNVAVYKQPAGSNGFYLRVDDSGPSFARLTVYETMSDVNTGTGLTPTSTQLSAGYYVHKTSPGDWIAFARGGNFHLFASYSATRFYWFCMTDLHSNKPGDAYGTYVHGQNAESASVGMTATAASPTTATGVACVVRGASATDGAVLCGRLSMFAENAMGSTTSMPGAPDSISGKYVVSPIRISEIADASVRGQIPGVLMIAGGPVFADRSTLDGTGPLAGRTFMAVTFGALGASSTPQVLIEITDNWGRI